MAEREELMNQLIALDFGKMDLDRCADVRGMQRFAEAWDVTGLDGHLFVIAHELWQPAHMALFTAHLLVSPQWVYEREWLGAVLTHMYETSAPYVKTNGLQSGLIMATHGLQPLVTRWQWYKDDASFRKLMRVGMLLTSLPYQPDARAFQGVIDAMQREKLPSMASKTSCYGVGHLVRSYMYSTKTPYPPGFVFVGLKTLRDCELGALITEACGPTEKKMTRAQLLWQLNQLTYEEVERASRERTPVTLPEYKDGVRYVGAKDLYKHMRKHKLLPSIN